MEELKGEAQLRGIVEQDTTTLHQSVRWPQNLARDWLESNRGKRDANPQRLMAEEGFVPSGLLPLLSEKHLDQDLRTGTKWRT